MEKNKNPKLIHEKFTDVSRFTRWVNQLDEKDKALDSFKRKKKWGSTLVVFFFLFALSFILFPPVKLDKEKIAPLQKAETTGKVKSEGTDIESTDVKSFDLPIDSFENQLKRRIHEHQNIFEQE